MKRKYVNPDCQIINIDTENIMAQVSGGTVSFSDGKATTGGVAGTVDSYDTEGDAASYRSGLWN